MLPRCIDGIGTRIQHDGISEQSSKDFLVDFQGTEEAIWAPVHQEVREEGGQCLDSQDWAESGH
jgi:hypothetical protein